MGRNDLSNPSVLMLEEDLNPGPSSSVRAFLLHATSPMAFGPG